MGYWDSTDLALTWRRRPPGVVGRSDAQRRDRHHEPSELFGPQPVRPALGPSPGSDTIRITFTENRRSRIV